MRIWDIPASKLCTKHLLGEHRELHAIWNILTQNKSGYSRHPETLRWKGKLAALYLRHEELADEMISRNYHHKSELDRKYATGYSRQNQFVNTYDEQIKILKVKDVNVNCGAFDSVPPNRTDLLRFIATFSRADSIGVKNYVHQATFLNLVQ